MRLDRLMTPVRIWFVRSAQALGIAMGCAVLSIGGAQAQAVVFLNDDPAAGEALRSLPGLIERGELGEAVREVQRVLESEPGRVLSEPDEWGVHLPARVAVLSFLLAQPELLDRYRQAESPAARDMILNGQLRDLERTRWATRGGFAASLSLAAERFESGAFDAASLTLDRLRSHPDAGEASLAGRAASLARSIAAYHAPTIEIARSWAERAGADFEEPEPIEIPGPARIESADAFRGGVSPLVEQIPSEPAWSVRLSREDSARRDGTREPTRSYPLLTDELLVVNTGEVVSAWDRYTLEQRWAYTTPVESGRVLFGNDPYPVTPTPIGFLAETPTRGGGANLSLLARENGEVRWSVPSVLLGQGLSAAEIVGAPLVAGRRVVVVLDAVERLRRLRSLVVVGLDLSSGRVEWRRVLGSSGVQRNNRGVGPSHAPTLHGGVVYLSSALGIAAAVEAETGDLRWVRPIANDAELNPVLRTRADQQSAAVVWEDRMLFVSPDRGSVVSLDTRTGRELQRRPSEGSPPPSYGQLWRNRLLLVARDRVWSVPASNIEDPGITVATYPAGTLVGRTMVAGDQLVIPLAGELGVVDLATGEFDGLDFRRSGMVVVDSGQVISVEDGEAHGYLSWQIARRELLARMEARPENAAPAITLMRLALRSERYDSVLDSIDSAIAALARRDDPEARQELFAAIREVVRDQSDDLERSLIGGLVQRLGVIASTPEQRSLQSLLLASAEWSNGRAHEAVEALHRVLDDDELTSTMIDDGRVQTRAGDIATARLREIVRREGASVYASFVERGDQELESLGDAAPDESYIALARRHPLAPAATRAWLLLADRARAAGDRSAEARALQSGLGPLWSDSGVNVEELGLTEQAGQIVGRLVFLQREQGRVFAAVQTLRRCSNALPGVRPMYDGQVIDVEAELASLRGELSRDARFPRIGDGFGGPPQVISGWRVVEPMLHDGSAPPTGHVLLRSRSASLVALWAGGDPESGGFDSDPLRAVWSRETKGRDPLLLRLDPDAVYLIWNEPNGVSIERVDTVTGETVWRTDPLWDVLEAEPNVRLLQQQVDTPLDGKQRLANIVVAMDRSMLAIVQRDGQLAAIDLQTGQASWTRRMSDLVVYEAAVNERLLVLAGRKRTIRDAPGAEPIVMLFDRETGRVVRELDGLESSPRWVRLGEGGRVVVGLDGGVALYSHEGERLWLSQDPGVQLSADAWMLAERCVVMGPDRGLRMLSMNDGSYVGRAPLDDRDRVAASDRVRAWAQGERLIFGTERGLSLFTFEGALAGIDALESTDELVLPALARGVAVSVSRPSSRTRDGEYLADVWFLSTDSGELLSRQSVKLGARPDRVTLIDGRVLITASGVTLAYPTKAPQIDQPAENETEPVQSDDEQPGEL